MITIAILCESVPGLTEAELRHFVAADWVRPVRRAGEPLFSETDIARVRLIQDLRLTLHIEEEAVPVVLSLVDQLYAARRQMRRMLNALDPPSRQRLAQLLAEESGP